MSPDDANTTDGEPAAAFALTIPAGKLSFQARAKREFNCDFHSQGNDDCKAHAHVYPGSADPLGSRGYLNKKSLAMMMILT